MCAFPLVTSHLSTRLLTGPSTVERIAYGVSEEEEL